MAKKTQQKSLQPKSIEVGLPPLPGSQPQLPPELEKKLKALKTKLDTFKKKVLDKFGDYIVGIAVLPPEKPLSPEEKEALAAQEVRKEGEAKEEKKEEKKEEQINLLVVVDDTTSQKMTKDELHYKFSTIIKQMGEEVDKQLAPKSILLTDLWQNCYDAKYDLNRLISLSMPLHDTGMLAAIKIAEIHKSMVLKKFDKYILSYVLAGSLTQGKATPTSDIDVWIVIDDTDVKKMTRFELKDKLRAIIIGMGAEAGERTGIKNKLNIQVYILTDFWESLKEANPIIFTLLRDGVPFYDRGIFMPWKQLLKMGHIKPSREAIDLFMSTGEQSLKRVQRTLNAMGMEDTYYAILTPSQAALMLYGVPPPTPRETPDVMEEIFVKKEKMLEPEYVKILKDNVKLRKEIEHGEKKELSGTELDTYVKNAEKFLKRISELFKEIEAKHDEKGISLLYEDVTTILRDVLRAEGLEKVPEGELVKRFEDALITPGKLPAQLLRDVQDVLAAKKQFEQKKLARADSEKARKSGTVLIKFLVEYLQRKRGRELERAKIRVKHGSKYGEVTLLDNVAFVNHDLDAKEQRIEKAPLRENGSLGTLEASNLEEYEKALAQTKLPRRAFIKEPIFEDLKRIFGRDVEVLVYG
ncbi:MAG TPA: nucleotidyltransferase domain-containing protein [Candidatus Nanoarchaeia archaeon]|nr:nucleotidyltransferase domain-containing protein [Candidatus Nanoarchaeia archaeon]